MRLQGAFQDCCDTDLVSMCISQTRVKAVTEPASRPFVIRETCGKPPDLSDQEEQPPPPPMHYSAPPTPPPRLERRALSTSGDRTRPTQRHEIVYSASQQATRLPDTFSNSVDVV